MLNLFMATAERLEYLTPKNTWQNSCQSFKKAIIIIQKDPVFQVLHTYGTPPSFSPCICIQMTGNKQSHEPVTYLSGFKTNGLLQATLTGTSLALRKTYHFLMLPTKQRHWHPEGFHHSPDIWYHSITPKQAIKKGLHMWDKMLYQLSKWCNI